MEAMTLYRLVPDDETDSRKIWLPLEWLKWMVWVSVGGRVQGCREWQRVAVVERGSECG